MCHDSLECNAQHVDMKMKSMKARVGICNNSCSTYLQCAHATSGGEEHWRVRDLVLDAQLAHERQGEVEQRLHVLCVQRQRSRVVVTHACIPER